MHAEIRRGRTDVREGQRPVGVVGALDLADPGQHIATWLTDSTRSLRSREREGPIGRELLLRHGVRTPLDLPGPAAAATWPSRLAGSSPLPTR